MRVNTLAYTLRKNAPVEVEASDADLFARFLDYRDEPAFDELVSRHVPAVRAVCRSVLRDPNDADDAAQAAFLVLVRRACHVRDRHALGAWLCRVAWRAANRLRQANQRREARLGSVADPDAVAARTASIHFSDELDALNDEIGRLPERYRLAVLTCYRAGLSTAEAANRLGWAKGTLLTRLAWARKRLRERLAKRGISLSASLSFVAAGEGTAEAILACRIVEAGKAVAAKNASAMTLVSNRVSTLTEGMVRAMIATKMKLVLGIGILIAALLGLGVGRLTLNSADAAGDDKKSSGSGTVALGPWPGAAVGGKTGELKNEPEAPAAVPVNEAPGNDLIVRRPLGSFTREVPAFGRATVTFAESRMHVVASVRIDKAAITVTMDADYSINRESVVYGIITGIDVSGADSEGAVELMAIVGGANDIPFSFRVRVDDDAIVVKDLKCGPIGVPLFAELFGGKEKDSESLMIAGIIGGKYKSDANPERNPPTPPAKPRKK